MLLLEQVGLVGDERRRLQGLQGFRRGPHLTEHSLKCTAGGAEQGRTAVEVVRRDQKDAREVLVPEHPDAGGDGLRRRQVVRHDERADAPLGRRRFLVLLGRINADHQLLGRVIWVRENDRRRLAGSGGADR